MVDPNPTPVADWASPHWDEAGYLLVWDTATKQWRRAVPDPVERPPDAGTTNCWTVVGGVEVHAYNGRASKCDELEERRHG